jgi:adenylosuccinate lyase
LGYTHFQPAQLTTVGRRACLWCYDFVRDLEEIEQRLTGLRFRGIRGATGTQASFLALFNGDARKVARLEKMVTEKLGFKQVEPITGQTYTRKIDAQIAAALANIAASAHKFANDIRLLAGFKEIEEPFEAEQVGSSAMAYKRNPMRCERMTGLSRYVLSILSSPFQTAAEQWFERTLDDSSNKRLTTPEGFLATDGILRLVTDVARGLVVNEQVITARVEAELPFMATEEILMAATTGSKTADRQDLHERIRRHSMEAARQVKQHGRANDLIERLAKDPVFARVNLQKTLDPSRHVGLAPQQVDQFLKQTVRPILNRYRAARNKPVSLSV